MTYRVKLLNDAQSEIKYLYAYLESKFGEDTAKEKYGQIKSTIALLKTSPSLGTPIPELAGLGYDHYIQLLIGNLNKIVYEINDTDKRIYVHIFCSTRQDFETVLRLRLLRS